MGAPANRGRRGRIRSCQRFELALAAIGRHRSSLWRHAREDPSPRDVDLGDAYDFAFLVDVEYPSQPEAAVESVLRLRNETGRVVVDVAPCIRIARAAGDVELAVLESHRGGDRVAEPGAAVYPDVTLQDFLGDLDDLLFGLLEIPAVVLATGLGFVTDDLVEGAVRPQHEIDGGVHRLGERAGILVRDLARHVAVVMPRIALGDGHVLGMRQPLAREPASVAVAVAFAAERIACPAPGGVSEPRRHERLGLELAAVHVDLTIRHVRVEHDDDLGMLHDAPHPADGCAGRQVARSARQAMKARVVRVELPFRFGHRVEGPAANLRFIEKTPSRVHGNPYPREIDAAVRRPRCRRGQVGAAVLGARHERGAPIEPLRMRWHAAKNQKRRYREPMHLSLTRVLWLSPHHIRRVYYCRFREDKEPDDAWWGSHEAGFEEKGDDGPCRLLVRLRLDRRRCASFVLG